MNNKWEFSQCLFCGKLVCAFFRLEVPPRNVPVSRLRLGILIMTEPLYQSSLIQYLINPALPAKLLQFKCQS